MIKFNVRKKVLKVNEFIFERKINYYETDRMGVVHHSNYIRFLEEARCALLEKIGIRVRERIFHGVHVVFVFP